jgi:hypothetical protein
VPHIATLGPKTTIVGTFPGCCARAASGHEMADPAITLIKSRRRIAFTKAGTTLTALRLQQGFATGEMGLRDQVAQQQS